MKVLGDNVYAIIKSYCIFYLSVLIWPLLGVKKSLGLSDEHPSPFYMGATKNLCNKVLNCKKNINKKIVPLFACSFNI